MLLLLFLLIIISSIITMKSIDVLSSTYLAGTNKDYSQIPSDLILQKVIVIHRHGDRAQIQKELSQLYSENDDVTKIWNNKMPEETLLTSMYNVAKTSISLTEQFNSEKMKELYSGYDSLSYPYAQLTQLGSKQLTQVGNHLRERYILSGNLFPNDITIDSLISQIYCRSTNICRTLQSLRSLLVGFFDINSKSLKIPHENLPLINTVPKLNEVLYPQGDGPCKPFNDRRQELLNQTPLSSFPGFIDLESRMKSLLGTDKINWLTVKEILTCHAVHDINYIKGVTKEDEEQVTKLTGFMWGLIYNDDKLNKLAIGRFLDELLNSIEESNNNGKKILFYSGHDSTLVPVLCLLGIYDNIWPPYASFLTLEMAISKTDNMKYVRATYNDKDAIMSSIEDNNSLWCSYEKFINRLKSMSLTNDQYKEICQTCEDNNTITIDEDVKAAIA